jgi:hypothetical protein
LSLQNVELGIMKNRAGLFSVTLFTILFGGALWAQPSLNGILFPPNPTSADNLKLIMYRACSGFLPYKENAYRIRMTQNNITVARGEIINNPVPTCPPGLPEEVDLGRLPAGNYTITVTNAPIGTTLVGDTYTNVPFTDARATKAAPYVRLDYSGSWWDPADSGWGLFIWQDAKSATDNLLVAWFTYTPDGKPMWYVTQPGWTSATATATAQLLQVSRLPGSISPPPTTGSSVSVGTASLDFTNTGTADTGKITYTFTGGATLTRNIQRFRP